MAKTVRVALAAPLIGHKGAYQHVELREPTASEFWEIGEPTRLAYSDGVGFRIENDANICAYIEKCVTEPKDPLLLGQLDLADGMKVKEAVLGFFSDARAKNSTTSSNS